MPVAASTASGKGPDTGVARPRRTMAPSRPTTRPTTRPMPSAATPSRTESHHGSARSPTEAAVRAITARTAGASLNPDSASSMPTTRRGSRTERSTENTAAESVLVTTAPSSMDVIRSRSSSSHAPAPVTRNETTMPTVASADAGPSVPLTELQRVVSPPSARISASAVYPTDWASCWSSNGMPMTSSPSTIPRPR